MTDNTIVDEAANKYADEHAFRVPYDGSNKFYDDNDFKWSKEGFLAGVAWQSQQQPLSGKGVDEDEVLLIPFPDKQLRDGAEIKTWMDAWEQGYRAATKGSWIDIHDRSNEMKSGDDYLLLFESGKVRRLFEKSLPKELITHWQPLPQPPNATPIQNPIVDEDSVEFLKYISKTKDEFIELFNSYERSNTLRVATENIIIAYDQLKERYKAATKGYTETEVLEIIRFAIYGGTPEFYEQGGVNGVINFPKG